MCLCIYHESWLRELLITVNDRDNQVVGAVTSFGNVERIL